MELSHINKEPKINPELKANRIASQNTIVICPGIGQNDRVVICVLDPTNEAIMRLNIISILNQNNFVTKLTMPYIEFNPVFRMALIPAEIKKC